MLQNFLFRKSCKKTVRTGRDVTNLWFLWEGCGSRHESPFARGWEPTDGDDEDPIQRTLKTGGVREARDRNKTVCFILGVSYERICLSIFLFMATGWNRDPRRDRHRGPPGGPERKIRRNHVNAAVFLPPRDICEGEDLAHLPGFKT